MYLASAFEKQSQHGRVLNLHSFYDNSEGRGGGLWLQLQKTSGPLEVYGKMAFGLDLSKHVSGEFIVLVTRFRLYKINF